MDKVLVVKKEKGMTSRDVVNEISHIFHMKKVGHTGTLDPLAQGVLVICMGKYTKLVSELTAYQKEYEAEVILGLDSDTLDITGNITGEQKAIYTKEEIDQVLASFPKKYNQEVPKYSAVKINGKKLYEYAREQEEIPLPKREVEIIKLDRIGDVTYEKDHTIFKIKCEVSKGTYIRSLIRDIAKMLGTIGIMRNLVRTKQGNYSIDDAYTLEQIKNNQFQFVDDAVIFSNFACIIADEFLENKIRNGCKIQNRYQEDKIVFQNKKNIFLAIYQVDEKDKTKMRPYKMLI